MKVISNKAILSACALGISWASFASSNDGVMVGKVYDSTTGQALYTEQHQILGDLDARVLHSQYYDNNKELIGERRVEYQNNRVQRYTLDQEYLGISQRVERTSTGLDIEKSKNGVTQSKTIDHKNPNDVVIDAGFDDFIVREWQPLMAGKTIKFDAASVGQMDVIALQIKRVDVNNSVLKDAQKARFEMNIANPLLRWLVTPITIEYFTDSRELASYRGISNLKGDDLKNYDAYIEFERDATFKRLADRAKSLDSKIEFVANWGKLRWLNVDAAGSNTFNPSFAVNATRVLAYFAHQSPHP